MDDSIQDLYQRLSLTKKESEEIVVVPEQLQDSIIGGDKCLIMKLFTDKHYNKDVFKSTMRKALRLTMGVRFRDLSSTLMFVEFDDRRDKEKVIQEGPWSFDKHLVLLKDVDGRKQVKQIQLTSASFWVRLHDLPLMARNEYVGRLLGEKIGVFEKVDVDEGAIAWGEFQRVCVNLQISKPLLRGSMFSIGGGEPVWVRFSYERLPNFCYLCGCLGHGEKECTAVTSTSKFSGMDALPYGMCLRVGGYNARFFGGTNQAK
ncbi:uncharacterized protein LOC121244266 [Juglans microcarpa x Juglans regia]|uniref:uncharacterized protein LOC121244266 n=1 Tax=Juglans microcarpa x Juglans regia TaxID=2249226 RepID=UPI001B7E1ADE|nr:uncharacterized protein LOC121244266 [Juglans microcarpa x Juglans regia]